MAKIKGTHNAMKTGMLAAEEIFKQGADDSDNLDGKELQGYET